MWTVDPENDQNQDKTQNQIINVHENILNASLDCDWLLLFGSDAT